MLEIHNSFNVIMQTLNVNEVCQVRVNSRNLSFTQTWENNNKIPFAKDKCDSLVFSRSDPWMVWRCHGISHVYCYYFCLEPTVRKGTYMRTTSVPVMVIFFENGILNLSTARFKVPSQQIRGTLPTAFWKIPYFTNMDQHAS